MITDEMQKERKIALKVLNESIEQVEQMKELHSSGYEGGIDLALATLRGRAEGVAKMIEYHDEAAAKITEATN